MEPLLLQKANPPSRRQELMAGVRGVLPLLVGVIPFGLIYGVLAVGAGLPHQ